MARVPRRLQVFKGFSVHQCWRGHNKEYNLGSATDKTRYLEYLNDDLECENRPPASTLQAITIMDNHPHEIALVLDQKLYSDQMRRVHSRYGMYFNRRNERSGQVSERRPNTTLLGDAGSEMRAVFYVHANPVRARMVGDARDYPWSTHQLYAFGKRRPWMRNIVLPRWYMNLGPSEEMRQREYRRLYARYLKDEGHTKQPIFKRCFLGPVEWCQPLEKEIREWRKGAGPPEVRTEK